MDYLQKILHKLEQSGLSKNMVILISVLFIVIIIYITQNSFSGKDKDVVADKITPQQVKTAQGKENTKQISNVPSIVSSVVVRDIFAMPIESVSNALDDKINNAAGKKVPLNPAMINLAGNKMNANSLNKKDSVSVYLSGVITSSDNSALAVINNGSSSKICAVGDKIGEYTVSTISNNAVVLLGTDGQKLSLDLLTKKLAKESSNVEKQNAINTDATKATISDK